MTNRTKQRWNRGRPTRRRLAERIVELEVAKQEALARLNDHVSMGGLSVWVSPSNEFYAIDVTVETGSGGRRRAAKLRFPLNAILADLYEARAGERVFAAIHTVRIELQKPTESDYAEAAAGLLLRGST